MGNNESGAARAGDKTGAARAAGETGVARAAGEMAAATGGTKKRRQCWTETKKQRFLEQLAQTCSISQAAATVGMSLSGLTYLRRNDDEFRAQFEQALQLGYEQVEADLLAHALAHGATVEQGESGPLVVPSFNPDLAFKLLQFRDRSGRDRRAPGGRPVKRATEREIEDALVAKLKGLAKRLALES